MKKTSVMNRTNKGLKKNDSKSDSLDLSFIENTQKYTIEFFNIEEVVTPIFVKNLRNQLNMSQVFFAKLLGVSNKTIEKWEQGKNPIQGTASRLLLSISINPDIIKDYYKEYITIASESQK